MLSAQQFCLKTSPLCLSMQNIHVIVLGRRGRFFISCSTQLFNVNAIDKTKHSLSSIQLDSTGDTANIEMKKQVDGEGSVKLPDEGY